VGKHVTVAGRGDDRRGDHWADAGDRRGTTTQRRLFGPFGEVTRGVGDLDIDSQPPLAKPMEQGHQAWRQPILSIFKDSREPASKERAAERDDDPVFEEQRPHLRYGFTNCAGRIRTS
jgi:hypothetical protein